MSEVRVKILLVEDDAGTALLARRRLEQAGYAVACAPSASAAKEYLRRQGADLILLDNRLPGATGLELYLELRGEGLDAPAILMTGFTSEETVIAALRAGMRDFIPKGPQFIDYLPQAVDRVLQQVGMERRLAEERMKLAREQVARAEAEAASRAKDFFLATLSHELRTPLQSISGWVRLLRTGTLAPDEAARALETIERNVDHQAELIEDLLDVSRIISGKLELERSSVDLAGLARELVEASQHEARAKGLQVALDTGATPLVADGDRKRLKQVLSNLLSNALKFTPAGGRIVVTVDARDAWARIVVADNGPGIDPLLLPRIFEPFSQGDAPHKPGLGLGLSIARHLVDAHGGRISAHGGEGGKGATFIVELPAAQGAAAASARPAAPLRSERHPPSSLEGLRVLIVDDDADSREVVRYALAAKRAQVQSAASVREALTVLEQFPADVIVTDIAMPGGDGYELLGALRKRHADGQASVPAVAFTAHASKQDRQRALEAGFQAYIAKPVDPFELLDLISQVHRSRPGQASLQ